MTKTKTRTDTGRVMQLPLHAIRPGPGQTRKFFDSVGLQELAESIRQHGVLQPLTVRCRNGIYELVAGERRLRAARLAGLIEVPCMVMTPDEEQSGMLELVSTLQQRGLDFMEEAEGMSRLMRVYGLSQEQIALRVGKSQSAVANKLRLLRHSPAVLEALRCHHLSERHARALLKLATERERLDAICVIADRGLNVAKTEQYIERLLGGTRRSPEPAPQDVRIFLAMVANHLDQLRSSGIDAACSHSETEDALVLTIRIAKKAG